MKPNQKGETEMFYIIHFQHDLAYDTFVIPIKDGEPIPEKIDGDQIDWTKGPFKTEEDARIEQVSLMKFDSLYGVDTEET